MNALIALRDDGPIVVGLGRLAGGRVPMAAPVMIGASAGLVVALALVPTLPMLAAMVVGFILLVGVLARGAVTSRFFWLVPAMIRAVEFAVVIRMTQLYQPVVDVQAYGLMSVVALHYYDIVYRLRVLTAYPNRWVRFAAGGWEVRLVLMCATALTPALPLALTGAALLLAVLFLADVVIFWSGRPASPR